MSLDFGGTKLAAAAVDVQRGEIIALSHCPTPVVGGAPASIDAIVAASRQVLAQSEMAIEAFSGIGISFGGPVSADRRTVMRSMHVRAWDRVDLPATLESIFGLPAFMDNDGNAAALGEWVFGAGEGAANLLYIQVSTGVGAGLIIDRKVYRGGGLAGEFGHLTVQIDGPRCSCGRNGCVESLCSGWAIARDGRALLVQNIAPRLLAFAGGDAENVNAEMVLRLASEGYPPAVAVARNAFRFLAAGIANAICLFDPERVVIGGGVARAQPLMQEIMEPYLHEFLPAMLHERLNVVFSSLGGRETLLGAALLTLGF